METPPHYGQLWFSYVTALLHWRERKIMSPELSSSSSVEQVRTNSHSSFVGRGFPSSAPSLSLSIKDMLFSRAFRFCNTIFFNSSDLWEAFAFRFLVESWDSPPCSKFYRKKDSERVGLIDWAGLTRPGLNRLHHALVGFASPGRCTMFSALELSKIGV